MPIVLFAVCFKGKFFIKNPMETGRPVKKKSRKFTRQICGDFGAKLTF
jgi:hypothetical protein